MNDQFLKPISPINNLEPELTKPKKYDDKLSNEIVSIDKELSELGMDIDQTSIDQLKKLSPKSRYRVLYYRTI